MNNRESFDPSRSSDVLFIYLFIYLYLFIYIYLFIICGSDNDLSPVKRKP